MAVRVRRDVLNVAGEATLLDALDVMALDFLKIKTLGVRIVTTWTHGVGLRIVNRSEFATTRQLKSKHPEVVFQHLA